MLIGDFSNQWSDFFFFLLEVLHSTDSVITPEHDFKKLDFNSRVFHWTLTWLKINTWIKGTSEQFVVRLESPLRAVSQNWVYSNCPGLLSKYPCLWHKQGQAIKCFSAVNAQLCHQQNKPDCGNHRQKSLSPLFCIFVYLGIGVQGQRAAPCHLSPEGLCFQGRLLWSGLVGTLRREITLGRNTSLAMKHLLISA